MNVVLNKKIGKVKESKVNLFFLGQFSSLNLPSDLVPTCHSQVLKTESFTQ